jgi:hypothetical protein
MALNEYSEFSGFKKESLPHTFRENFVHITTHLYVCHSHLVEKMCCKRERQITCVWGKSGSNYDARPSPEHFHADVHHFPNDRFFFPWSMDWRSKQTAESPRSPDRMSMGLCGTVFIVFKTGNCTPRQSPYELHIHSMGSLPKHLIALVLVQNCVTESDWSWNKTYSEYFCRLYIDYHCARCSVWVRMLYFRSAERRKRCSLYLERGERTFGPKKDTVWGTWKNLHKDELRDNTMWSKRLWEAEGKDMKGKREMELNK